MITIEKLKIYDRYKGDVDYFAHASSRDRKLIAEGEFSIIASLIQDLKFTEKNQASISYTKMAAAKLHETCDAAAVDYLKTMIQRY